MGCGVSSPVEQREVEKEASATKLATTRRDASISRPNNPPSNRMTTPTNVAERDGGEGTHPNPLSSTARDNASPPAKMTVTATVTPQQITGPVPTTTVPPPQPTATAPVATTSSSQQQNPNVPSFPSYTITDSRGCRVVTMIQNRVKVETMCKWLDNVLRAREDAGGVFRSIDAHRENPLLREDTGRETSSVSSRAGYSRASEQSMTVFLNVSTTHDMQSRTMVGTTAAQGGSQVDEQLASRAGPINDDE